VRPYVGFLLLAVTGCTMQWRQTGISPTVAPKTVVEIWREDSAVHWRALIVSPDSISGIPYPQPITCKTCRHSLARSDIDSVRVRRISDAEQSWWRLVAGLALLASWYALLRWG
jgi:hypothetical protein